LSALLKRLHVNKNEVVPKINVPVKSVNKVSYVPITNAQQNWSSNLT
jgi:hypothetical protein